MAARRCKMLKSRTDSVMIVLVALFVLIAGRAFYIQTIKGGFYREQARLKGLKVHKKPIPAERGVIYDRAGRELATSLPGCAVFVHPDKIKDKTVVGGRLALITGLDSDYIQGVLATNKPFVYLGHRMPQAVADGLRKENLPAVGVEREPRRVYACGILAANLIGFTGQDNKGQEGVERAANRFLAGKDGYTIAEVDSHGRVIPETRQETVPQEDGKDVVLTVDAYLQHLVEQALKKSFEQHKAAGATAIVMDPNTGEVLAMANFPTFDPNNRRGVKPGVCRNRALTDLYEPGSTLKLITVAAGLQEGMSPTAAVATCTKGGMQIGNKHIHCSLHAPYTGGHGAVNMFSIIRHSCNIGAATVAMRLGADKLYSYEKAFGLMDRPDCGLPGAAYFPLPKPDTWGTMKLANVGFGQGVSVSALQMASAYSVVANGGNLMKPQIIREVHDRDGKVIAPFSPKIVRRVISEASARKATEMLVGCVDEGTGKPAQVPGYSVAGKTGSAQKASTTGKGYSAGKFVASFMGFLPASNPRLVICVVVDEPQGTHWGATVAAPVFQEIAQKAMWYLKIPPDVPVEKDSPGGAVSVRKVRDRLGAGHTG